MGCTAIPQIQWIRTSRDSLQTLMPGPKRTKFHTAKGVSLWAWHLGHSKSTVQTSSLSFFWGVAVFPPKSHLCPDVLCWVLTPLANKVIKQNNNVVLTHKAYTGRVLCAYSAEVSKLAAEKRLDVVGPRRIFGKWLKDQVQNGGLQSYLNDPKLPLQSACMPAGLQQLAFLSGSRVPGFVC